MSPQRDHRQMAGTESLHTCQCWVCKTAPNLPNCIFDNIKSYQYKKQIKSLITKAVGRGLQKIGTEMLALKSQKNSRQRCVCARINTSNCILDKN